MIKYGEVQRNKKKQSWFLSRAGKVKKKIKIKTA
jgi:hypothetical protein